jgi:hypothetical protein
MCEWQVDDILFHEVRVMDRRQIVGIGTDGVTWRYIGSVTYERFDGEPNIHETHDTDDPWLSSENGWRKLRMRGMHSEQYQRLSPREKLTYLRSRPTTTDVSPHVQRETMSGTVSARLGTGGQNGQ